jgi:nitric oxide synthase oxygenase domain/subunit
VFDVEHNALNETFEVGDNNLVDGESYQLLPVVDHNHEVVVEVDPCLLKDDYLVEYHTCHVVVEQTLDKLNKHLLMMNHLWLGQFCMENKQHWLGVQ